MTDTRYQPQRTRITRAKLISAAQYERLLDAVRKGPHPLRDEAMVRLSMESALRAQEIAGLQWLRHVLDSEGEVGDTIHITSDIGKGTRNRVVERELVLSDATRDALIRLKEFVGDREPFVIYPLIRRRNRAAGYEDDPGCTPNTIAQYMRRLYADVGLEGCSSHSGRRTFITDRVRSKDPNFSIRDVQLYVGHRNLNTTAGYIEPSANVKRMVNAPFTYGANSEGRSRRVAA